MRFKKFWDISGRMIVLILMWMTFFQSVQAHDSIIYHGDYGSGIWRMNPDGSGQENLTNHGWFAEYSPDSNRIAFGDPYNDGIWVMNSDGTGGTRLTTTGGTPSWSPDGSRIVYFIGNRTGSSRRIYLMNSNGSNSIQLSDNPGSFPKWSPDGSKIMYTGEVNNGIWLIDPDGTNETQLYSEGVYASWSHDGTQIVYVSLSDWSIWIMNANGTGNRRLSNKGGMILPSWSPDDTKVIYENDSNPSGGIWIINKDGTNEHLVNSIGHAPDWVNVSAYVDSCTNIFIPGKYVLTGNLSSETSCVRVNSSDIVLDGRGYMIDGYDLYSQNYGIEVHSEEMTLTNVTLINLNITGWKYGIFFNNTINGSIVNNNISSNFVGIQLYGNNNNITGNKVELTPFGGYGIGLHKSQSNKLYSNTVQKNNGTGIILGDNSTNNFIGNNNVSLNGDIGIWLHDSSNNNLSNNILTQNGFEEPGNGHAGILVENSYSNTLLANNLKNNFAGMNFYSSSDNEVRNNYDLENLRDFFSRSNSINNSVVNQTLDQLAGISFTGKDIEIKGTSPPAPDPPNYNNINKFIKITNTSIDSWALLNISYSSEDLIKADVDESTLRIWRFDIQDESWSQVDGINNVDMEDNYVFANTTHFGIFAPMGKNDSTPPNITIESPENITYTKAAIPLNVSADENISEWKYSLNGSENISINPNTSIIASQGIKTLTIYAIDMAGNWNSSTVNFYVDLIDPVRITIISPENDSTINGSVVNVSASMDTLVNTVLLNWDGLNESVPMNGSIENGILIYNGSKKELDSGIYSFKIFANDSSNIFNVSETRTITVDTSLPFFFNDSIDDQTGNVTKDIRIYVPNNINVQNPSSLLIPKNTKIIVDCDFEGGIIRDKLHSLNPTIRPPEDMEYGGENVSFEPICKNLKLNPEIRFVHDAQIYLNYTHDELITRQIMDIEDKLSPIFYNNSSKKWEDIIPFELNISENFLKFNINHLSVFALAVPAVAVSSSGGGTGEYEGDPSVITKEPFENIEKFEIETRDINDHISSTYSYSFNYGIYEIIVNGKNVIKDVSIRVELLKGLSRLVREPAPGIVHYYQNIWAGTKDANNVIIRFREENSWISSQNLSNVRMMKWDGSKWVSLETRQINKDDAYTYFESGSDGFSSFAVTGEKIQVEETIPQTTAITPEKTTPSGSPTGTPTTTEIEGFEVTWNVILVVLILILGLIIIVLGISGAKSIQSISPEQLTETSQEAYGEKYYKFLLEQYTLYLKTDDRIKERQHYSNNYFLIFNSIYVTIFGVLIGFVSMAMHHMWQYLLLFTGFLVSIVWGTLTNHNLRHNSVRLALICEIESRLPVELHISEKRIMEENIGKQLNYSMLEQYIPWIFAGIYVLLMVIVLSGLL